ncbi:hypothetical protein ACFU7Y_10085 [Kitasatospora sp. NPDC057542]|uniref:hypothetical protein n=1 Tax=Kitasatospora sp. NPDC057542 TaxID=3346162 RepID=UPI00369C6BF2
MVRQQSGDSPDGLLGWILKRWSAWSGRNADFEAEWPADDILTFVTIYWVNQAIGSSIRAYKNASLYPPVPVDDREPYVRAPAGFTFLLGDSSPGAETPEERVEIFRSGGARFCADIRDVNVHRAATSTGTRIPRPGSTATRSAHCADSSSPRAGAPCAAAEAPPPGSRRFTATVTEAGIPSSKACLATGSGLPLG